MELFERQAEDNAPLADRMRPRRLQDVVGQEEILGEGKLLSRLITADKVPSMILWGPPGSGKTTLANVVANETSSSFVPFSAVLGGVPELRKVVAAAKERAALYGKKTILFVDEIHRFNKAQQDALLPHVENGTVTLIGATTENPSFAVNAALLSRTRVFELKALEADAIGSLLRRALTDRDHGLRGSKLDIASNALDLIANGARGDARRALSALELAAQHADAIKSSVIDEGVVAQALASKTLLYDKTGEEHYNVISAFIKAMRGTDPDAAIYWMMRMLEAGEEPLFVLRRMIIFASEDIGNADPRALQVAIAADQAFQRLGMPEGIFAMAQCCIYLASAPKSNASYKAWTAAKQDIDEHGALPVPLKLRNATTKTMKSWGYGDGYRYPHDEAGYARGETYLPEQLESRRYYEPKDTGYEAKIRAWLHSLRAK